MTNVSLFPPTSGASLSACGRYRYRLWRRWHSEASRRVLWIMLNPSTADASKDDPTIRRCIGFSKAWGYGALDVVNLFAFRTSSPAELRRRAREGVDVVGLDNDHEIRSAAQQADLVVAAWGRGGALMDRDETVKATIKNIAQVNAVRLLDDATPEHPLYLPGNLRPVLLALRNF